MKSSHDVNETPSDQDSSPLNFEVVDEVDEPLDIKPIDIPALILFWLLMLIVFLQFFTRYVLNDSLGWTEEIARFLLVLVGFAGAVTAVRKGSHIFLEFMYRFVPPFVGKCLAILSELISIGFYATCCWVTGQIALKTHQSLISLPVPKASVYWAVSACFAVMAIYSVFWLIHKIRLKSDQVVAEVEEHAVEG